jgi:hypothetical protein
MQCISFLRATSRKKNLTTEALRRGEEPEWDI